MKILNLRDNAQLLDDPNNIYIGRAGKGQDGYFGNPFRLRRDMKRGQTLASYVGYFVQRLLKDDQFRFAVESLNGKNLVCFCAPQPCHGHIMRAYIMDPEGWWKAWETGHIFEFIDASVDSLSPPPTS